MIYVLALFAALVAANEKTKKCLSTSLGGALQKGLEAADLNAKVVALNTQINSCNAGKGFSALVSYEKMHYAHRGVSGNGAFSKLMEGMKDEFGMAKQREFFFTYKAPTSLVPTNANFKFEIFDDNDLMRAIDFSRAYNFALKLELEKIFDFRDPQYKQVVGPIGTTGDEANTGMPKGRTMKFTKTMDETDLRVYYYDNFGVRGPAGAWCRWELQIDGKSCNPPISGSMHNGVAGEDDRVASLVGGYCKGIAATKAGEFHTMTVKLTQGAAAHDCYTGYQMAGTARNNDYIPGQNFVMEAEEMLPGYQILTYMQAIKAESLDVGRLTSRQLTFEKTSADTYMRVFWKDNLRKYSRNGCHCRWEFQFNNGNCGNPAGGIAAHIHASAHDNDHMPKAIVGYCKLPKGTHKTSIYINRSHSWCDCHTGWGTVSGGDNYVVEVREIGLAHERVTWIQKYNQADGRDHGYVNHRTLTFTKLDDDTSMRFVYSDNLRVYGVNRKCQWELWIDGTHCKSGKIAMTMHTTQNDNDHQPGTVMGYCDNLEKGSHTVKVFVNSNDGNRNHDCYTGNYWGTPNNWVLEAEESMPVTHK